MHRNVSGRIPIRVNEMAWAHFHWTTNLGEENIAILYYYIFRVKKIRVYFILCIFAMVTGGLLVYHFGNNNNQQKCTSTHTHTTYVYGVQHARARATSMWLDGWMQCNNAHLLVNYLSFPLHVSSSVCMILRLVSAHRSLRFHRRTQNPSENEIEENVHEFLFVKVLFAATRYTPCAIDLVEAKRQHFPFQCV